MLPFRKVSEGTLVSAAGHRTPNPLVESRWRNNGLFCGLHEWPSDDFSSLDSALSLHLSPRIALSPLFCLSFSLLVPALWLHYFLPFFWSCSSPLVFQTMFSFFHHCCLPPLSFVARAARPIARNGLTRLCRWYLERRSLFFVHRSCAINVKRPLVRSASLLCFWIEDGRIRGSLGIISELLTLMAVLNLWYRTERNFEFISSGLIYI